MQQNKRLVELIRQLIRKEIKEMNSTASVGGEYSTPHAFRNDEKEEEELNLSDGMSVVKENYYQWKNNEDLSTKQKIARSMTAIRDSIDLIDKAVKYNVRLKNEMQFESDSYMDRTKVALNKISEKLIRLSQRVKEWDERMYVAGTGVPDAPYKKDWHELAFKRFLMEGINDPSVDRITWTSGAVQADRYDLSKHLSEVHLSGSNFVAYDHDGNTVIKQTGVRDEDLPDLIGKEAAEKLLAQPKEGTLQSLTGLDLQLGGEFHKNLYDKKIPQFAKKFLKKYGVEPKRISDQESEMVFELTDDFETPDRTDEQVDLWMNDEFIHSYPNRKEAEKFLNEQENLWYIDITPEMRRDLQQKGVPLAMNPFLRSEKLSPFMA